MKNKYLFKVMLKCSGLFLLLLFVQLSVKSQLSQNMRVNLYRINGAGVTTLMDGNLTDYDDSYSNEVDMMDAWKMNNFGENFGIRRSEINLVVERRQKISYTDTTFLRMWNMQKTTYQLRIVTKNLNSPGLTGYIEDSYLNHSMAIGLNDTSFYPFTVNYDAGSFALNRFRIIFLNNVIAAALPVRFTGISLFGNNNDIRVNWKVENELSIHSYHIEHSVNGRDFEVLKNATPVGTETSKMYSDKIPGMKPGKHFFRISAESLNGKFDYSSVAIINTTIKNTGISVYPNPVLNKTMQMHSANLKPGTYALEMINNLGQRYELDPILISNIQSVQEIRLPDIIRPGIYRLRITGADQYLFVQTISVY